MCTFYVYNIVKITTLRTANLDLLFAILSRNYFVFVNFTYKLWKSSQALPRNDNYLKILKLLRKLMPIYRYVTTAYPDFFPLLEFFCCNLIFLNLFKHLSSEKSSPICCTFHEIWMLFLSIWFIYENSSWAENATKKLFSTIFDLLYLNFILIQPTF